MDNRLSLHPGRLAPLRVWAVIGAGLQATLIGTAEDAEAEQSAQGWTLLGMGTSERREVRELLGEEAVDAETDLAYHGSPLQHLAAMAWLAVHAPYRLKEVADFGGGGAGPGGYEDDIR